MNLHSLRYGWRSNARLLYGLSAVLIAIFGGLVTARSAESVSNHLIRLALMDFATDDNSYRSTQAAAEFTSIVQSRLDRNKDGNLDDGELAYLRSQILLFAEAPPQMLAGRKILVAPILTNNSNQQ